MSTPAYGTPKKACNGILTSTTMIGHTSHWGIKLSLKFIAAGMAIETIRVSRARTA